MIKAIITDIEGTTSSISFVHDVLFPYARQHIADFVREHAEDAHVSPHLNDVRVSVGKDLDIEGIIHQLHDWIDADAKVMPLKALQGLIWEKGYKHGDFKSHMYPDAVENLKKWHAQGIRLFVYSSGSVYAQQLLFGHTEFGDLNNLFEGYFDTRIGGKKEVQSYETILKEIRLNGQQVMFLSDIEAELAAASATGIHTYWLIREGQTNSNAAFKQVSTFDDITFE